MWCEEASREESEAESDPESSAKERHDVWWFVGSRRDRGGGGDLYFIMIAWVRLLPRGLGAEKCRYLDM